VNFNLLKTQLFCFWTLLVYFFIFNRLLA